MNYLTRSSLSIITSYSTGTSGGILNFSTPCVACDDKYNLQCSFFIILKIAWSMLEEWARKISIKTNHLNELNIYPRGISFTRPAPATKLTIRSSNISP